MKTIITLSALALLSNLAIAESFTYEQQIASPTSITPFLSPAV